MIQRIEMVMRHPEEFRDIKVERTVELLHDGMPVVLNVSSIESVKEDTFLKEWEVDTIEQYMTLEASRVYRGKAHKGDMTVYFHIEKLF